MQTRLHKVPHGDGYDRHEQPREECGQAAREAEQDSQRAGQLDVCPAEGAVRRDDGKRQLRQHDADCTREHGDDAVFYEIRDCKRKHDDPYAVRHGTHTMQTTISSALPTGQIA